MTKGAGVAGQIHISRIENFLEKKAFIGKYSSVLHTLHRIQFLMEGQQ
jgi:hypothetical protein